VGAAAEVQISSDAKVVDLSNRTELPGLTDCHTHLTMSPFLGALPRAQCVRTARGAVGRAQRACDPRGGLHHGAQRCRQRVCGCRAARRYQCR
jgi:predicted amidohydrolase YtcJ